MGLSWVPAVAVTLVATSTCLSRDATRNVEFVRQHVFMVGTSGEHLDPGVRWGLARGTAEIGLEEHLERIKSGISEYARRKATEKTEGRVVLFVHGGNTSLEKSRDWFKDWAPRVASDGCYPILIAWDSGAGRAYWDHLTKVRGGVTRRVFAAATAPFMLSADLATGLVRTPITIWERINNDFRTTELPANMNRSWPYRVVRWESYEAAIHQEHPDRFLPPQPEKSARSWNYRIGRGAFYALMLPARLGTLPLVDGLGAPAWVNLSRRSAVLFESPDADSYLREHVLRPGTPKPGEIAENPENPRALPSIIEHSRSVRSEIDAGELRDWLALTNRFRTPMAVFTDHLVVWTRSREGSLRWVLGSHSMGANIVNDMLSRSHDLRLDRVVYLGAACSIRQFVDSVGPYLRSRGGATRCICWSLHRLREAGEPMLAGMLPWGSMLSYLDENYSRPRDLADRTLGSWSNVAQAQHHLALVDHVQWRCFDFLLERDNPEPRVPQRHGELDDFSFWTE